jgi:hypothetical protein
VSLIDEIFDESELLSDDDKAALAAEEAGVDYEPEPEPAPEMVEANSQRERELAAEQEREWRLDERMKAARETEEYASRQQPPTEPPSRLGPRPDDYIDPIGADLWDTRRDTELLRLQLEGQQAERQRVEFTNWVQQDASQFRTEHPDYDQATAHAYAFRVEYWKGLGLDDARARRIVDQEAMATATLARQGGKSAAARFYELAKQVGYQSSGAQQPTRGAPARQRQSALRGKPQARAPIDVDAITEGQLESAFRKNPRATNITRALERRALLDR